jgi:hypothetical protein
MTGQAEDRAPTRSKDPTKDQAAVVLGRKGGLKGSRARADKMSAGQRAEIVRIGRFGSGEQCSNYTASRISLARSIALLATASYCGLIASSAIARFTKSGLSFSITARVLVTSFLYGFNSSMIEFACFSPAAAMSKMSRGFMLDPR